MSAPESGDLLEDELRQAGDEIKTCPPLSPAVKIEQLGALKSFALI